MSDITIALTRPVLSEEDAAEIDTLAAGVLASPEDAERDLGGGAVIVQLASRAYELRAELRAVLSEWTSLQADYRHMREELRNAVADRDRLHDAATRFAAELAAQNPAPVW